MHNRLEVIKKPGGQTRIKFAPVSSLQDKKYIRTCIIFESLQRLYKKNPFAVFTVYSIAGYLTG